MPNRYEHKNHRKHNPKVHIILVTKYRKRLLTNGVDAFLKKVCNYLADQNGWNIIAMETDKDHIHILLEYDTIKRICDIISILKRQTTHYLWKHYKVYLSRQYWKKRIFWSDGYFACSIGEVSLAIIEKYIAEQG